MSSKIGLKLLTKEINHRKDGQACSASASLLSEIRESPSHAETA